MIFSPWRSEGLPCLCIRKKHKSYISQFSSRSWKLVHFQKTIGLTTKNYLVIPKQVDDHPPRSYITVSEKRHLITVLVLRLIHIKYYKTYYQLPQCPHAKELMNKAHKILYTRVTDLLHETATDVSCIAYNYIY